MTPDVVEVDVRALCLSPSLLALIPFPPVASPFPAPAFAIIPFSLPASRRTRSLTAHSAPRSARRQQDLDATARGAGGFGSTGGFTAATAAAGGESSEVNPTGATEAMETIVKDGARVV